MVVVEVELCCGMRRWESWSSVNERACCDKLLGAVESLSILSLHPPLGSGPLGEVVPGT